MSRDSSRYETLRYPGKSYEFTHPDRLATVARLHGLVPPEVDTARVLELGCGDGTNLLAMACSLPGGQLLGVDACAEPLEDAVRAASELGVTNLELRAGDVAEFALDEGAFDYVVAHGVLSWVPDVTKRALMAAVGRALSPHGVALVSYNALPGWRFRVIARDIVLAALGRSPGLEELSEARQVLRLFADQLEGAGLYGAVVRELTAYLDECSDALLYHDLLAPNCDAFDFIGFAALAEQAGLQYVAEAVYEDNVTAGYPAPFRALLERAGGDVVAREQLIDVMRNTLFRRAVLCRAEREVARRPRAEHLRGLFATLSGRFEGEGPEGDQYRTSRDLPVTVTSVGMRRALRWMRERAPDVVTAEGLAAAGGEAWQAAGEQLVQAHAGGLIELLPRARPHSAPHGDRPKAYPLARWQALRGAESVVNCCHEQVAVGPIECILLTVCDGQRTRDEIVDALLAAADAGEFNILVDDRPTRDPALRRLAISERLDGRLDQLREVGLLAV